VGVGVTARTTTWVRVHPDLQRREVWRASVAGGFFTATRHAAPHDPGFDERWHLQRHAADGERSGGQWFTTLELLKAHVEGLGAGR
jgi:hypothetical protein